MMYVKCDLIRQDSRLMMKMTFMDHKFNTSNTEGGGGFYTGVLIADAEADGRSRFMTANRAEK